VACLQGYVEPIAQQACSHSTEVGQDIACQVEVRAGQGAVAQGSALTMGQGRMDGFKAFKDWRWQQQLAEQLAEASPNRHCCPSTGGQQSAQTSAAAPDQPWAVHAGQQQQQQQQGTARQRMTSGKASPRLSVSGGSGTSAFANAALQVMPGNMAPQPGSEEEDWAQLLAVEKPALFFDTFDNMGEPQDKYT